MNSKKSRKAKIVEIVENNQIETQEEIVAVLKQCNYKVTQATVSRDIKELKLIKVMGEDGRSFYSDSSVTESTNLYEERVKAVFRESVLKIDNTHFMIVIHTLPAMAQAAASAIDAMEWENIAGTIAGDDTIFVALKDEHKTPEVVEHFQKMMK